MTNSNIIWCFCAPSFKSFSFGRFLFEYLDLRLKNSFEIMLNYSFISCEQVLIGGLILGRFSCPRSLMGYNQSSFCFGSALSRRWISSIRYQFQPNHFLFQPPFLEWSCFESNSFRPLFDISAYIPVFFRYLLFSGDHLPEFSMVLFLLQTVSS